MNSSRFERAKNGALMGGTIGLCIGLVFGTVTLLRYGPGRNGYVQTLGRYMVSSAATFGFFMSVGSVVRSDGTMVDFNTKVPVYIRDKREE
ncbi:subunit of TIM23 translocase complex [Basidiobolus ranarum]|uniref:Subunit of TIM23 translocase complex n=1 Tax=Basidiobolus ranarum TaxID=34480 RepID=A0ABR2W279_9FUNG